MRWRHRLLRLCRGTRTLPHGCDPTIDFPGVISKRWLTLPRRVGAPATTAVPNRDVDVVREPALQRAQGKHDVPEDSSRCARCSVQYPIWANSASRTRLALFPLHEPRLAQSAGRAEQQQACMGHAMRLCFALHNARRCGMPFFTAISSVHIVARVFDASAHLDRSSARIMSRDEIAIECH